MFTKKSKILITGGNGFLGNRVVYFLKKRGYQNLIIPSSKQYDLRDSSKCHFLVKGVDVVIHLAANVGGIGYNLNYPADLFYDNIIMGVNLLHESSKAKVKKFVAVGTVCAYPKYTPVPFREEQLWDGYPEETNAAYGLAKKMLLVGGNSYRTQYGLNSIYLIPVNMYGPKDNMHLENSHVIPALISKFYKAKKLNLSEVVVWGTGKVSREFLFVDDGAKAIVQAMEKYNDAAPINIGTGLEITISELVDKISALIGFKGKIIWDKSKPDGQPRRCLNVEKAEKAFDFKAKTDFNTGLKKTIQWYSNFFDKQFL